MSRWILALCVLFAACGGPTVPWSDAPSAPLDLRVAVAPGSVQLLQPVAVTLDLWAGPGVEPEFAPTFDPKDFAGTTRVVPAVPLFGGTWHRTVLELKPVRGPGELVLPPFTARQKGGDATAATPETKVVVATALVGQAAAIEAPGQPFPTPFQGAYWIAGGAGAGALAAAVWWWWRSRPARVGAHPDAVALPPHVTALRALQRLRGDARTTPAEVERFYVAVSDVLRSYLEARFGLHAPERTTEEFLRELEGGDGLARAHRSELERFLSQCDLVKFAAHVPTEHDHLAAWALAEQFVQATRADRAVEAVA
ncbi:MAG: hypothetical protein JNK15_02740 [Planctomycetes bacterium]|nr:hypothetical protein [Planctomycetota bacterium]